MALTLGIWFISSEFGFSFFELVGLGASGVGFAAKGAAGAVGEFVVRGDGQCFAELCSPLGGVVRRRRPEEDVERRPGSFEAHAAGRFGDQGGGLAAELGHEVIVDRTVLEATGFGDGENAFEEAAAAFALSAEGQLAVDHGGA